MANVDLQSFLQDRLVALDPSIDISPGSPAQTKFISPVVSYLGTDPFETDIDKFLLDRFAQEFPDLYGADPGALRDLFVKPLQLVLEPFKREIATIRRNQSLIDPSVLSEDDADALIANVFDSRDRGGFAGGTVRAYFPNPTDVRVEVSNRVFSKTNLNFFPTGPVSLTAELMSFNRDGGLFFMDIPVRAEVAGSEYNLEAGDVAGVEGIPNLVRASNLKKLTGGSERQDNETFVAAAEVSLTERSLANRRGTVARLNNVFKGQLRAVQVVGAKDPEMRRDLLVASSPGHSWITGRVSLYKNVALVRARTVEGPFSKVPAPGDTLYIYLTSVAQEFRLVRLRVEELLIANVAVLPYQYAYFLRWSDPNDALKNVLGLGYNTFLSSLPQDFEGGCATNATCQVSSLQAASVEVASGEVHVFGHADIYVRPTLQDITKVVVDGVYGLGKLGSTAAHPYFAIERTSLTTTPGSNIVSDVGYDFVANGVLPDDMLVIESGPDAGRYVVGSVSGSTLALDRKTGASGVVRYRIMRSLRINPFEPRIPKFPFGNAEQRDLKTNIGSTLVSTTASDMLVYGAAVGDTVRVLEGPDAGDYIIQSFDSTTGGQGMIVDRPLSATGFALPFEVFTALDGVQKPLVRVRELLLLDSARQSTGLTIPPADPVAVVPVGPLTSAKTVSGSQTPSGFVLPDLTGLLVDSNTALPLGNQAASSGDRRYSLGFDAADGTYVSFQFMNGGTPTTKAEFDLRSDTSGKTSFFLSTVEIANDAVNYPPVDPKPGECLSLKSGPNKGDYLIKAVHKFKYTTGTGPTLKTFWLYFIQIYGVFQVDPFKEIITFLKSKSQATGLEVNAGAFPLSFPDFFVDFYNGLGAKLVTALNADIPGLDAGELQAMVESSCSCFYEWGVPARGVFRSFFREPTLFEQKTGLADEVTLFTYLTATGEERKYRPDPARYGSHEIVPARLTEDAQPTAYPRDVVLATRLDTNTVALFTTGTWVYGGTSNAYGRVEVIGTTYLIVSNVTGTFQVGETLTGEAAGTATISTVGQAPYAMMEELAPTLYLRGVTVGDLLSLHEEIQVYGSAEKLTIVQTSPGSPIVATPPHAPSTFPEDVVGAILFIEEGDDAGGYRVTKRIDANTLLLDRTLGSATTVISKDGSGASLAAGAPGTAVLATSPGSFDNADIGSYVTLYGGVDFRWMGAFLISAVNGPGSQATLTLASGTMLSFSNVHWAVSAAPANPPDAISRAATRESFAPTGTACLAGVPVRFYEIASKEVPVVSVLADTNVSQAQFSGTFSQGRKMPYHILRPNIRRVTPAEMNQNKAGFLYYFDTDVVSLSPSASSNIDTNRYLTVDSGSYEAVGYRHVVEDSSFSYSMEEDGFLDLPLSVLPVNSADSPENMVRVIGAPLQISYERADIVDLVQSFAESASDRLISANLLVRHFLPAYLSYDATYQGGSDPSVVAKDVRTYLDQIPVETPVDVSEIERIITGRGGNPDTPSTISATVYDWDRKMAVEFSQNTLGSPLPSDTKAVYNGSPRIISFMPGPDVSGQDPLPEGERINLTRR